MGGEDVEEKAQGSFWGGWICLFILPVVTVSWTYVLTATKSYFKWVLLKVRRYTFIRQFFGKEKEDPANRVQDSELWAGSRGRSLMSAPHGRRSSIWDPDTEPRPSWGGANVIPGEGYPSLLAGARVPIPLKKNIPAGGSPGFSQIERTIKNYQAFKETSHVDWKSAGMVNNRLRPSSGGVLVNFSQLTT